MDAQHNSTQRGIILALSAYTLWGIAPIYFKALQHVGPLEILSHRVIWSVLFLAGILAFTRGWHRVKAVIKQPRLLMMLTATALLVGTNWLIFIWAVNNNFMLNASLGYYINPLVNVLLGMLFLGERLRPMQWLAVLLAGGGVMVQLIQFGSLPWIALALATSFGCYGLLRKKVNVDAASGLFLETAILLPLALFYVLVLADSPTADWALNPLSTNLLLVAAGIVTTLPLLCFTGAATKLKLSTLGFFQYIGPSLMFLLAITLYGEQFTADKGYTFAFIWGALLIFVLDAVRHHRRITRLQRVTPP
ncbi:EamA family transporter RarD [Photobacterium aphoticum]|uniref:Chloramphenical resistance permease RarD n=1 Tax=Photobacterium aphoticum TaxID=754436 RepID=A0A0J1GNK9_9GAMM|nr:EamA family transporter RarD [Photobacterium aphoticum]KLV01343.1 chloramphenical resistance permease RarD [Photobacterium aphoticum]PSU54784.1 EamA family transporter RarD [Photobacterium aphoticum]GHA61380.1 transporter [Photobacterium aphoticum]